MKKALFIMALCMTWSLAYAQDYSVRRQRNGVENDTTQFVSERKREDLQLSSADLIQKAGIFQRKAAILQQSAIVSGIVGGVICAASKGKQGGVIAGCGFFALAFGLECVSLNYQYRSGVALEISGTKLKIKF